MKETRITVGILPSERCCAPEIGREFTEQEECVLLYCSQQSVCHHNKKALHLDATARGALLALNSGLAIELRRLRQLQLGILCRDI